MRERSVTRWVLICLGVICLLVSPGRSNATALTVQVNGTGERVVFDSANNNMWYWDLSAFASQTYGQQLSGIQQLNTNTYFDLANWHLASLQEMEQLWRFDSTTIREAFHPSHERYEAGDQWHYWSGRYEYGSGGIHAESETAWGNFVFGAFDYAWPSVGYLTDTSGYQERGAFVVASVPEPSAASLCGMVGLALFGFRRLTGTKFF